MIYNNLRRETASAGRVTATLSVGAGGCKKRLIAALLAMLALSACATAPTQSAHAPNAMPLLSAESLGQTRSARQIVRAAFADNEVTMQCVVDVTPRRISVIALNAMGLRLFSVVVEDGKTTVERSPGVPEQVQPELILSDIQLAYWPLSKLQQAYAGTDLQVSEPFAGTRRLKRSGRLIAEVHYAQTGKDSWRGRLWLSNYQFGYSLSVTSQPQERGE